MLSPPVRACRCESVSAARPIRREPSSALATKGPPRRPSRRGTATSRGVHLEAKSFPGHPERAPVFQALRSGCPETPVYPCAFFDTSFHASHVSMRRA